jgi:cysteinyl-tRNA synthetase, unknown class
MGMLLWLALLLGLSLPSKAMAEGADTPSAPSSKSRSSLRSAKSWAYLLQGIDTGRLARTAYDVLVLDGGDGENGLGKRQLQQLKRKPDGSPRLVLAYINIGEAEDYRSYWNSAWTQQPPAWLGSANQHWKGDHRVRHWHQGWRDIVFGHPASVLARIIEVGFDGAYLDRVDVYQFWCGERPTSFADMVAFVEDLSNWAKARKPGFMIVAQNGEELLQDARYRAAIDGLGKEDFLFGDRGNDVLNLATRIERAEQLIGLATADGIPVLAIEYARNPENQELARQRHGQIGSSLYFGPRSLAYLGQGGPQHKEDGDSEPYLARQGPLGCPATGG